MSLILDALKRAERERRAILPAFSDPDPSALSQAPGARRRRLRTVLLLVAGLAVAVAVALWLRPSPPPPATQAAAAPVPDLVEIPATEPPAVLLAPAAPDVIPGTEGMVSLDDLAHGDATVPAASSAPDASPPPEAAPLPKTTPAAVAPATAEPELPPGDPAALAEPAPESTAATPPPALTQPAPLRRFREMTPEYRADFPALTVEVHFYDRAEARRWVMVNGRRYKQGERLAEGPALLEIVPEGLVLEYRGEKLLYPLSR